jgi:hypothetical protein
LKNLVKSNKCEYFFVSALDLLIIEQASCMYSTANPNSEQSEYVKPRPPWDRQLPNQQMSSERAVVQMNPGFFYIHEKEGFISSRAGLTVPEDKTSV